jgi:hypothetical protein
VRDPGHRQQFAHLLETDLQFAARDHGADALALADQATLAHDLVCDSQTPIELGSEVFAADARRVSNRFRLQEHAAQGVGRADVGLGHTGPHRHADGRAGDGSVPVCQHQPLRDETAQQAVGDNHDVRDFPALEPVRDRGFARPHGRCPGNDFFARQPFQLWG